MEKGCQKSKRLSYMAKFKHKVIQCAEEKGNRKDTAIFGADESNVRLWQKHKTAISKCEASRRKCTVPKKGQLPETDDAVFTFFQERRKIGLSVSCDLLREEAIKATSLNIRRSRFKASKGWAIRFMRQMGLALQHRTICQKFPKNLEQELLNYQRYITNLRKTKNFLMGQIANANKTAIYLDMPTNYTLEKKGVKEVLLKTTGCKKLHLTVMLAATADWRKLPPLLILKRKTLPKLEVFPKDVIVRAQQKGWMTEELMLERLKIVWSRRPEAFLNQPSMPVLDAFKGHVTDSMKDQLYKMKTDLVVIPGGMTSMLQQMGVSINKLLKDRLRQQYLTWIMDPACELTETEKIKCAAPSEVARWVSAVWKAIPESIIISSFKKCCLSNALDGSKNDIVWEDDVEDGRTMLKIKMIVTGWRARITIHLSDDSESDE
jgi:hypothetical protein